MDEDKNDIFEEDLYKTLMRRFDVAWDIHAAIIIDRFRIDMTGAFGMLDIIKTDVSMHEYRISIGLGYGVSPSRVSNYISGRAELTLKIARVLCTNLGMAPAQVLGI